MERWLLLDLLQWKKSVNRKPLILHGIRRVGKTWALREFGRRYYKNVVYFNFKEHEEYKQFFVKSRDLDRILQNLMMASTQLIKPEETLIIFDEIQECPQIFDFLEYFGQHALNYHLACAGTLLQKTLALKGLLSSGQVDFLEIRPLSFSEFLIANGDSKLNNFLNSQNSLEAIPEDLSALLWEKLKMYLVTGGMPEAVGAWTEDRNVELVQEVLADLLGRYERDFAKLVKASDYPKILRIWQSIPAQLAKSNKKFTYQGVAANARAREYAQALQWLCDTELTSKVYRSNEPGIPRSEQANLSAFKLYLADVGLLRRLTRLSPAAFAEGNRLFTEFKGALSENFIFQTLRYGLGVAPCYWLMENPHYEVDFILVREDKFIPLEINCTVNSNVGSKNLQKFQEEYGEQVALLVRFSMGNLTFEHNFLNIPLFMADYTDKLIELALRRMRENGLCSRSTTVT